MISSIDVYVLTISTFLSMIVAVVVAMKALGHLISPSCPQPLFQSGVKRKATDMKIRKFHWWFPLCLVLKTRVFGTRKWPIKNCNTTTLDFEDKAKSASLSRRLRIAVNSFAIFFPFNDAKNFTILIFLYLATLFLIQWCFQYCLLSVHYVFSWPNKLIRRNQSTKILLTWYMYLHNYLVYKPEKPHLSPPL